ncbi:hypothetical protein [Streptomyces sp. NPDC001089]
MTHTTADGQPGADLMDIRSLTDGPRIIDRPAGPEELLDFMGEHIVAFPAGRADLKTGGTLIGLSATHAHLRIWDGSKVDFELTLTVFSEPEERPS